MRKTIDIFLASMLLITGLGLLSTTFGDHFETRTFGGDVGPAFAPRLFLMAWSVFAAIALAQALISDSQALGDIKIKQLITVVLIATITALTMTRVGFVITMIPGLCAFCWAFGYRKVRPLIVISIFVPLGVWALFTFGFELLLPRSPWFYQI